MKVVFSTSTMADGPMGPAKGLSGEEYARRVGFAGAVPVMTENVHGNSIAQVTEKDAGKAMEGCDGLVTTVPNLPLLTTHQDCVPIVLRDAAGSKVAIIHAGWRGVVKGIFPKALAMFADAQAHLGPHIRECCFEIQEDAAAELRKVTSQAVIERDGKLYGNLSAALRAQAGSNIEITEDTRCTKCSPDLFSWRRDGKRENNLVTVAMLQL